MGRTWKDVDVLFPEWKNADMSREKMTEEREREWVDFCFDAYENGGFAETFRTPYEGEAEHVGEKFSVIGRVSENDADMECLPMWTILLESGKEIDAFPEEICLTEKAYGCTG